MSSIKSIMKGVIHGNVVTLDDDAGLPDGQEVNVTLQPLAKEESRPPGEGLRQSFGAWEDDADELDRYLEWNRQQRKVGRPEIER